MPASTAGLGARLERYKYFYILLLPAVLFYFVFNYVPMYGIVLAFKRTTASTRRARSATCRCSVTSASS